MTLPTTGKLVRHCADHTAKLDIGRYRLILITKFRRFLCPRGSRLLPRRRLSHRGPRTQTGRKPGLQLTVTIVRVSANRRQLCIHSRSSCVCWQVHALDSERPRLPARALDPAPRHQASERADHHRRPRAWPLPLFVFHAQTETAATLRTSVLWEVLDTLRVPHILSSNSRLRFQSERGTRDHPPSLLVLQGIILPPL